MQASHLRVKYTTEFTIKNGQIRGSRVIGEEYATADQQKAIAAAKPLLRTFIKSRLPNDLPESCTVNVKVKCSSNPRGFELIFSL